MCWRFQNKSTFRILIVWIAVTMLFYTFLGPEAREDITMLKPDHGVQSVVFIAMGKLAKESIVDGAIASLRIIGKWEGGIHILTDSDLCFEAATRDSNAVVMHTDTVDSIIKIKAMKARLFDYLPKDINSILYMDVDILVTKNLNFFLHDLHQQALARPTPPDYGMFLDAGGHFFGFCSGCEKWHTGIIWMQRGVGTECLASWETILLSGKFETDQESIDEAENQGRCPNAMSFSSKHLLFAKDYFAMFLTPSRTFVHLTAISRIESQDFFYKNYIVPSVRTSVRSSGLNMKLYEKSKKC
jgi:hypothetical protein